MKTLRLSHLLLFCGAVMSAGTCYAMSAGTITFQGAIVTPAPAATVAADGTVRSGASHASATTRVNSLIAARLALPTIAVLDYFQQYAPATAKLATIIYN